MSIILGAIGIVGVVASLVCYRKNWNAAPCQKHLQQAGCPQPRPGGCQGKGPGPSIGSNHPQGVTVLSGKLDQAALHGVTMRIRDLGLKLVSVRCIEGQAVPPEDEASSLRKNA